jgi:alkyldihydroxyacetonephosphate synthase
MQVLTHDTTGDRDSWGRDVRPPLPTHARRWLRRHVGPVDTAAVSLPARPRPEPTGPSGEPDEGPPSSHDGHALGAEALDGLVHAVGPAHVRTDRESRAGHAGGMSYLDLVRRRRGQPVALPDAVVLPASHDEVLEVLRVCARHDVAVVPFGGGTSVVGGVEASRCGHHAVVAVDLTRMDRLLAVDTESLTATLQAGLTGPVAERLLGRHGLTLGHFPQSYQRATLGGYAATRSAGQASTGYGRFDEMVVGIRVATPVGELRLGHAPAWTTGPDLRQLVLGSEGTLGIVTELTVRVRSAPQQRRYEAWSVRSFEAGTEAVRALVQDGLAPDVTRLSDADETQVTFALAGPTANVLAGRLYLRARGQRRPCLLVLGWEGSALSVRARRSAAARVLRRAGAVHLGQGPGRAWRRGRFDGPFLRDTLLDAGLLVETVETAAPWSALGRLRTEVVGALRAALGAPGNRSVVTCHLSHAYPTGASLYFTAVAAQDPTDPVGQWSRAKHAVTDTIVRAGGALTHHHGVGLDHAPWLDRAVGSLGLEVLRAVRQRVDPQGICNPGKLVPPRDPHDGPGADG